MNLSNFKIDCSVIVLFSFMIILSHVILNTFVKLLRKINLSLYCNKIFIYLWTSRVPTGKNGSKCVMFTIVQHQVFIFDLHKHYETFLNVFYIMFVTL